MPSRIVKGDHVAVIAGAEKGKRGIVARVVKGGERVVIHNVNTVKKHVRPSQKRPEGGIVDRDAPIHISNVMLIDPTDNRPTRVGFERQGDTWIRVSRRTGAPIPVGERPA
jgi:large subunit ribosomal protein L24